MHEEAETFLKRVEYGVEYFKTDQEISTRVKIDVIQLNQKQHFIVKGSFDIAKDATSEYNRTNGIQLIRNVFCFPLFMVRMETWEIIKLQ